MSLGPLSGYHPIAMDETFYFFVPHPLRTKPYLKYIGPTEVLHKETTLRVAIGRLEVDTGDHRSNSPKG